MSVKYQLEGDVAVISLNRPDRFNAIEVTLAKGVIEAVKRAEEESRAIVVTGKGKAFCSGADLSVLQTGEGEETDLAEFLDNVFHPMVHALTDASVPVVAAVNGVAAGAGMGVALGCDIRVMAESAFFTSAFTAIGLAPDSGTTYWLPQHVGVSKAIELAMTNKRVPADEAYRMGLCAKVVTDNEIVPAAVELAENLADMVPDSLVTTRNLIRGATSLTFNQALQEERREQGRLGKTAEHREGVAAFLEKRKPDYRGV
jgi:2-(1,2-epoxy-1,2-dihydrophenyl)acetyl-CoA isomerase